MHEWMELFSAVTHPKSRDVSLRQASLLVAAVVVLTGEHSQPLLYPSMAPLDPYLYKRMGLICIMCVLRTYVRTSYRFSCVAQQAERARASVSVTDRQTAQGDHGPICAWLDATRG
jgi:hypothetical protein